MKHIKYFFAATALALLLAGCSSGRYVNMTNNLNLTQTTVNLSENNFKVVKTVQTQVVYKQTSFGFKKDQLMASAYAQLLREADLQGSQALVNVTIEKVERGTKDTKVCSIVATGMVIEFTK